MKTRNLIYPIVMFSLLLFVFYEVIWRWGIERTWVPPHKSLQITRLTGGAAEKDMYAHDDQQGVVEQMLGPGRHFVMPWDKSVKLVDDFEVPPGHIALLRNNVGKDLPEGRFLAGPDEKGTQKIVLTPGVWRLNEFGQTAYIQADYVRKGFTKTQPQVFVPPGYVGVQTLAEGPNKGILPTVLQAGYYAINPEQIKVTIIGIGYEVLDLHVTYEDATIRDKDGNLKTVQRPKEGTGVSFPLADGKQMYLDMDVVYGIFPEDAPRVVGEYGTEDQLKEKIIIPQVLSICKNAGSDLTTQNFITGGTREKFQEKFTLELQKIGKEKGIHFLIALVRGFHPDPEIAETIQAKRVAEEEMITLATEQARDTIAAELQAAKRKVQTAIKDFDAETTALVAGEKEEGLKTAATTKAGADRKVAALDRKVAETTAEVTKISGKAEADVQEMVSRAEADLFRLKIAAHGGADAFGLATFAQQLPADLRIEYRYAGPGTLWSDVGHSMQENAAKVILTDPSRK